MNRFHQTRQLHFLTFSCYKRRPNFGTPESRSIFEAALERRKQGGRDADPYYIYLDEFQNFVSLDIARMLAEVRKFGLFLILAHQYFEQLDEDITAAAMNNCQIKAVFGGLSVTNARLMTEELFIGSITTGASNDIERAVEIARRMVSEFGMSPLGPIHLGASDNPHSQTLLDRIEEATNAIVNTQLRKACEVMEAEQESIARLVERLMERDTLEAKEILECFENTSAVRAA